VGIEHVGIGCDFTQDQPGSFFDWIFARQGTRPAPEPVACPVIYPQGLQSPEQLVNVAVGLAARGYGQEDLAMVLGGNWLRLFAQVWGDQGA